ncbi:MAG: hypothetical protein U0941_16500 [Planctomycetaceae bacterium]
MTRFVVRGLALALAVSAIGVGYVEASAPGGKSNKKVSTKTVTEAETEATLKGAGSQVSAKGHAESKVITVTNTVTNTTTVNSCLSITVKGLANLEGQVVTFNLGATALGTGTVKNGRASLKLSSKTATVPTVSQGDTITVVDPDGITTDLSGAFGAVKTETETCGK